MPRIRLKTVAACVLALYLAVTCYSVYFLVSRRFQLKEVVPARSQVGSHEWNPWGEAFEEERPQRETNSSQRVVEIWGKAAIGLYLWEHIFEASLEDRRSWRYGEQLIDHVLFRFRTGPAVVPDYVPSDVEYLVLVLNGRASEKQELAEAWLEFASTLPRLKGLLVVLLGHELCDNRWIDPYMVSNGGRVQAVFIVYDEPRVDDKQFFQWPLGVATYRSFPRLPSVALDRPRRFLCNFLGTLYPDSSRVLLVDQLQHSNVSCLVRTRDDWLPQESDQSRQQYVDALVDSDLTLHPVGVNTECYRLYEAMEAGSVPIVEDQRTFGRCSTDVLRLLKQYGLPAVFVQDWSHLRDILREEDARTLQSRVQRRLQLIEWYRAFRRKMRDRFVSVLRDKFFHST